MATYFSQILFFLTLFTGFVYAMERLVWSKKRAEALAAGEANSQSGLPDEAKAKLQEIPGWIDTAVSVFPVLAFVLILRSFLYEPFQIPSGSMMPTLLKGDFILVEKYAYGLREPLLRKQIVETGAPQRGDVIVFKYPESPNVDYIKRVVGVPGDSIIYRDKQLYVKPACDGTECPGYQPVEMTNKAKSQYLQGPFPLIQASQQHGETNHQILVNPAIPDRLNEYYSQPGTQLDEWKVPADSYFVLGDNRDNSRDSRFWGFVPEEYLVGKAVFIWMSFEFERSEDSWLPSWIPTGIRFERLGSIE
ncbi:signal peptidase I [Neiella marina]|uniref:Signal peptidase I n=1 Tax=Neiella marina TaxID=508461 RepID=A0A8J2U4C1_9GAMM|nr:signal peptidase I [Neiella marina]GGA74749.1 signal peptidase I [Neiella marina]